MLTDQEKQILLDHARASVRAAIFTEPLPVLRGASEAMQENAGAFVTLYVGKDLRGCIGYVEPVHSLHETVAHAAKKAAVEDFRFQSISSAELSRLRIHISVIGEMRKMMTIDDVVIGEDGIIIEYGSARGLLLPQVAVEWNWGPREFLEATCRKAGVPKHIWKDPYAEVLLFKTESFGDAEMVKDK